MMQYSQYRLSPRARDAERAGSPFPHADALLAAGPQGVGFEPAGVSRLLKPTKSSSGRAVSPSAGGSTVACVGPVGSALRRPRTERPVAGGEAVGALSAVAGRSVLRSSGALANGTAPGAAARRLARPRSAPMAGSSTARGAYEAVRGGASGAAAANTALGLGGVRGRSAIISSQRPRSAGPSSRNNAAAAVVGGGRAALQVVLRGERLLAQRPGDRAAMRQAIVALQHAAAELSGCALPRARTPSSASPESHLRKQLQHEMHVVEGELKRLALKGGAAAHGGATSGGAVGVAGARGVASHTGVREAQGDFVSVADALVSESVALRAEIGLDCANVLSEVLEQVACAQRLLAGRRSNGGKGSGGFALEGGPLRGGMFACGRHAGPGGGARSPKRGREWLSS